MKFIKNLLKKKPGGSTVGNLLRKTVQVAQGYVGVDLGLGSGANRIEIGQTKTNKELADEQAVNPNGLLGQPLTGLLNQDATDLLKAKNTGTGLKDLAAGLSKSLNKGLSINPQTIGLIVIGGLLLLWGWRASSKR